MTSETPNLATPSWMNTKGWDVLVLGVAAIGVALMRRAAFDVPLEADECNYILIGRRLLEGGKLYVDVWDHQPPGIFAIFAGIIALFGDADSTIRWSATGATIISLFLLYNLTKRLASPGFAAWACLLFVLVSSDPGTAGDGCNREVFMNVFVLAAWLFASYGRPRANEPQHASNSTLFLVLAGVALGIGSTIKTVLAMHWLFLTGWIVLEFLMQSRSPRQAAKAFVLMAAGPSLIWILVFAYFAATQRLTLFVDAAFYFNLSYSEADENFISRFLYFFSPERHPFVFRSALPLWIGTIAAAAWLVIRLMQRRDSSIRAALALLVGSYAAVCLPGRAWPHYYYLMIPALIMAVTIAMHQLTLAGKSKGIRTAALATMLLITTATAWREYHWYLNQPPFGITVARYNSRDFWAKGIGEKVAAVTDSSDRIFVYSNDPGMYYYAGRQPASRFTMVTGLRDGYSGVDDRRKTLLKELSNNPPRMILVQVGEPVFDGWPDFLAQNYGPAIGVDRHDKKDFVILAVFAHKSKPVEAIDWEWHRREVGGW
ncbi:MAG: ArnT family glycosyltransferase [Phycisphaerae bacterium]